MKKGVYYFYQIPNFDIVNPISESSISKDVIVRLFIPVDWNGWSKDDFVFLSAFSGGIRLFGEISFYGHPKKGICKDWELIKEEICHIKINDLDPVLQSSLNVDKHPNDRVWVILKNAGLSNGERNRVKWTDMTTQQKKLEQKIMYSPVILYYRLIIELIPVSFEQFSINSDYHKFKSLLDSTMKSYLSINDEGLEDLEWNFLKDFSGWWGSVTKVDEGK